jgi:multiple sugar transport system substrate-binding protein
MQTIHVYAGKILKEAGMKKFVIVLLVLFYVVFSVGAAGNQEETKSKISSFDWKNLEGESLRIVGLKFYYSNYIEEYIQEFKDLTGIDVSLDLYPEDQMRQKLVVELASGQPSFDVFMTAGANREGYMYSSAGWYEDLNPFINSSVLTNSEFDVDDFLPAVFNGQDIDGNQIAVPLNAVTWLLYYRSDVFTEAGLNPPETLEDMLVSAKQLDGEDFYGYAGRGTVSQIVATWSKLLFSFGGSWVNDDRTKATINSEAAIKATEMYVELMTKYSNPGALSNGWPEVQALMSQGQTAMILDASAWNGVFQNPEKSAVVGKVGFAVPPAAKGKDTVTELWSWNMAISPFSDNKEAAWYFIQWATGKEMQERVQSDGFPTSRNSSWNCDAYTAVADAAWLEAVQESFKYARPTNNPPVIPYKEFLDLTAQALIDTIQGKGSAEENLNEANVAIQDLLDDQ